MHDPTSDEQNLPSFAYAAGTLRACPDPAIANVHVLLAKKAGEITHVGDLARRTPTTFELRSAAVYLRQRAKGSVDGRPMLERAALWLDRSAEEAERLPPGA